MGDERWRELHRERLAGLARTRAAEAKLPEAADDWWQASGAPGGPNGPTVRPPVPLSVTGDPVEETAGIERNAERADEPSADRPTADPGATARTLAAAPQEPQPAQATKPRHIDDVEPPRKTEAPTTAGEGPRPFRPLGETQAPAQPIELSLAIGGGRLEFRSSGERYDSKADVVTFRANAEPVRDGAGVELTGFVSDSDLFAGRTLHDGTGVVKADAQAFGVDAFPHVVLRLDEEGPLRVPLRVGAFADWLQLDHDAGGLDRSWFGFGARAQLLPELRLAGDDARSLDLVGRLGGDIGGTWFHEEFSTGDDSASTSRLGGEVGLGIRYRSRGLFADAGYRFYLRSIGHTDTDLFGDVDGTETRLQELFLGVGGRF